ncbi:glycine cleavage system protein GcvH [bacterium]|nr:glycine cleavage system protein GcvH [bacterium]MCI0602993.1 glycine cleavage system protein GcvH [bacterium]
MYPKEYLYTKEHEWIKKDGSQAVVGITIYAQKQLGDIVFVELPQPGKNYEAGKPFGSVESVKAVSEIYAPVSMEVVAVNNDVVQRPELINEDAHDKGWLIKIKVNNEADLEGLLSAEEYEELISQDQH